jgi:hypothetical protein
VRSVYSLIAESADKEDDRFNIGDAAVAENVWVGDLLPAEQAGELEICGGGVAVPRGNSTFCSVLGGFRKGNN